MCENEAISDCVQREEPQGCGQILERVIPPCSSSYVGFFQGWGWGQARHKQWQ